MRLAILQARLKTEMEAIKTAILNKVDISKEASLAKHAEWVARFLSKYARITETTLDEIIRIEIGNVFMQVLVDAGVYKDDAHGRDGFRRFIRSL